MWFRVLGQVEAEADGRLLTFARRRERCLVGLLLLEAGRVVPKERLIELLWGDDAPPRARRILNSNVARVRSVLGAAEPNGALLVTRDTGYVLSVDPDAVDAHRFRALVAKASATEGLATRADLFRTALDLWRGPLLGDDADDVLRHRVGAELEALRLSASEQWLMALIGMRRYDDALPPLARLTAEAPEQERFAELHMTALYLAGRKADALTAYERARSWFSEHLGIDPAPALRELHEAILRDEVAVPGVPIGTSAGGSATTDPDVVPAELPADVAGFVGRDRDLDTLHAYLPVGGRATAVIVNAIGGTAGVGKTALAVHFGHRIADRFPDGQLYVNLRGYARSAPMSPIEALTRLLGSLAVPPGQIPVDIDAAAGLYRSRLAGKRMLVLLDNAGSAEQVRPLLPAEPGCLTLITSRDRLAGLVASHGARQLRLDTLEPGEAVALLTEVVGADRAAAEASATAELATLCAYLPLALRIAAANLAIRPQWAISEYVEALKADRLGMLEIDGEAAVRSAFNLSYARLAQATKELFRLLGLVPGSDITADAAGALAGTDAAQAARLLDQLAATHLIEEHHPGRYTFHDLLRSHAREQAEREVETPARQAAIRRLGDWYLSIAAHAAELAYPQVLRLPATDSLASKAETRFVDGNDAMAWLDSEHSNLVAIVVHAAEHAPRMTAWLLADSLRGYFVLRHQLADRDLTARSALRAATEDHDVGGEAVARLCLGDVSRDRTLYSQAAEQYEAALLLAERADWSGGVATAHNNLALLRVQRGEIRQASRHLSAALEICRRNGDVAGERTISYNLGAICANLGRLEDAETSIRRAVTLHGRGSASAGHALAALALVVQRLGRIDEAIGYSAEAVELNRAAGHRFGEAMAHLSLAAAYCESGQRDLALESAGSAQLLGKEGPNHHHVEAAALNVIGAVRRRSRDHVRAIDAYQQARDCAIQAEGRYAEVEALIGLGAAYTGVGQYAEALTHAQQALAIARDAEYRLLEGLAMASLAEIHGNLGDDERSRECAEQAIAIHRETGYRLG